MCPTENKSAEIDNDSNKLIYSLNVLFEFSPKIRIALTFAFVNFYYEIVATC